MMEYFIEVILKRLCIYIYWFWITVQQYQLDVLHTESILFQLVLLSVDL